MGTVGAGSNNKWIDERVRSVEGEWNKIVARWPEAKEINRGGTGYQHVRQRVTT